MQILVWSGKIQVWRQKDNENCETPLGENIERGKLSIAGEYRMSNNLKLIRLVNKFGLRVNFTL